MKRFFSRNRRLVEIVLTLGLVFLVGGYYYLIYIPARENEIISRRFRTLQRIEKNMQEKFQGYQATVNNLLIRADESFFDTLVKAYNKSPEKFRITILKKEVIKKAGIRRENPKYDSLVRNYDSLVNSLNNRTTQSFKVKPQKDGKKLTIVYDWYKSIGKKSDSIIHVAVAATIDYREFLSPLLKKGVFDRYIVFNVYDEISNIIYEDFSSGISFKGLDSLFGTTDKIYTSRIINIETAGEKYMAFLHPCGYNNKNDRIVAGLLKLESFDKEKRRLPEGLVTALLFVILFSLLLLPLIRLAMMGKKERIRFFDLFAGYFSFLLLIPVIILVFFWSNKRFLKEEESKRDSKQVLANQVSRSLKNEIAAAFNLLDKMDSLYLDDPMLKPLVDDTINVHYLNDSAQAEAHFFFDKKFERAPLDSAVRHLVSVLNSDPKRYRNTAHVFWMDSTGREMINWAFGDDPPRGNYKERTYFKNVYENKLLSLEKDPAKNYALEPIVSRIDGKFKLVLAKHSRVAGMAVASVSNFSSVINPVLPLGFEFSITDADGKTIFSSDTTENLNENLNEEFVDSSSFKVALDTRTSQEFTTRHEDQDYTVFVQPISGLPYFTVIFEKQSFIGSLNTQSISFTMVMMFSFFIFLCIEMILILIAHYRQSKLQKNRFDFSWIHPEKVSSHKYYALFLYNSVVLIILSLFCFIGFSIQRLTEYIFLFIMAALLTSIVAFAFRAKNEIGEGLEKKRLKREKIAVALLSAMAFIVLLGSFHYGVQTNVLLFSFIAGAAYFIFFKLSRKLVGNTDYLGNFRLMIFSRLLLTSGLPVIVFFNCIYNFEQRLEQRLKLLDYAKNVEQHTKSGEGLQTVLAQLGDSKAIQTFYTDSAWVNLDDRMVQHISTDAPYSKTDSLCINLLKTSRLHYNDVSGNTEGFELIRPFGINDTLFAFNTIFGSGPDTLKYRMQDITNNSMRYNYITLSSGLPNYSFPSMVSFPGLMFWAFLFGGIALCYQLLRYATDKVFGENIPVTEDFKLLNQKLLVGDDVKYLFVQGIPGSRKSAYIKDQLGNGGNFIFYDKEKQLPGFNAKFFDLGEIPGEAEMADDKEAFDKQKDPYNPTMDNWYRKLSMIEDKKIECIVFTHFEYKIFDGFTNSVKLKLIEKMMGMGKKKIIISSDIDPVEYFHSLKKFMPKKSANSNKIVDDKVSAEETDRNSFFEYLDRWNNLLGSFTNIYKDTDPPVVVNASNNIFKEAFLAAECSTPAFLNNYKAQLRTLPIDENNEEDYILKIQSLCDHSYRHLLSSLTKEEQLTLYDLAEDGLMNTTNYIALTMLLNKGLIKKDGNGVLMIVNRSFRNFILTVVHADEIKGIEKEINDDHTWNDYKYPVLIILGALLYFVLSSNPEKFGNILPIISGVLAGIPTITKLLSFLKPGDLKE